MESFLDYYFLHHSSEDLNEKYSRNIESKTCRFCGKSSSEVSFNTLPHIIPELFGRNNISSNFECDNCNRKFQKYESDVSTMIQHYLGVLNIKSKNGVPVFKSQKDKNELSTTLRRFNGTLNLNFNTNIDDFEFDDEKKTLSVNFRTRKFSPFSVYKVFLKMGISLLSAQELEDNKHFLEFLNSEVPINNGMQIWTVYRYVLKTKYYSTPKVNLYRAKETLIGDTQLPEYTVLINFANVVFQFFLPISVKNYLEYKKENNLRATLFPVFLLEDISMINKVEVQKIDLNETKKVSITDNIVFYYDKRVRDV